MTPTHSDERRDLISFPEGKLLRIKQDAPIGKHYHLYKSSFYIKPIIILRPMNQKIFGIMPKKNI